MTAQCVCAVIVTYHPTAENIEHMSSVAAQMQRMVVVDNASGEDGLSRLRIASRALGFHLIENAENLGIAEALNQGVRWAKGQDYPWVILFDQDSNITGGFIREMFMTWERHPQRELVGSLHPSYVDPDTGLEWRVLRASDGGPVKSVTSGALMPAWIFDKIGFFASDYFIDEVDSEYCYRIRAAGYLVGDSREAVLLHHVGHPTNFKMLGITFRFRPLNHSALRRYYMSRNRIVVCRKYFPLFPGWVWQHMKDSVRETIKCFIAERDRARKLRSFLLGTWDGLTGKMGKREGL